MDKAGSKEEGSSRQSQLAVHVGETLSKDKELQQSWPGVLAPVRATRQSHLNEEKGNLDRRVSASSRFCHGYRHTMQCFL